MENAAKALEMAGGILIAILVITMFTYMFNNLSENQAVQTYNAETDKLKAFNAKYLAYDKSILYGADIISVINQALSNNVLALSGEDSTNTQTYKQKKYGYYDSTNPNCINIKFSLAEADGIKVSMYKKDESIEDADLDTDGSNEEPVADSATLKAADFSLKKDTVYDLTYFRRAGTTGGYDVESTDDFTSNKSHLKGNPILSVMPGPDIKISSDIYVKRQTTRFIKKVFKCVSVEYHASTGKIKCMTFKEFDPNINRQEREEIGNMIGE